MADRKGETSMSRWIWLTGVTALMAAGGGLAYWSAAQNTVSAAPALELWNDVLRDADQAGLHATRMSVAEEELLGNKLGATFPRGFGADAERVRLIGVKLTPFVRRNEVHYEFHVVPSDGVNALALPGGKVFVLRGLLRFVKSDDELASVIGHEMAHVDLRHCAERYQYRNALKRIGVEPMGQLVELARLPMTMGYAKYQELDADAQGVRMSYQAGYRAGAAADLFDRMSKTTEATPAERPGNMGEEAGGAVLQAAGSYFASHPRSDERARKLRALARQYRR
jgi:predicted Zn-dependent protease